MEHPTPKNVNTFSIKKAPFQWDVWVVLFLALLLFGAIVKYIDSDIEPHARKIIEVNTGESAYPPNFLYYFITNLLSGFTKNIYLVFKVSVVVLAVSVTAKYMITKNIIQSYFTAAGKNNRVIAQAAASCLLLFALPDLYNVFYIRQYYLGRIVPNVWHNSTTIFLFPFAMLLFWKQYRLIEKESENSKTILLLILLAVLNVLIKPSFFLVFAPVTSIFLLIRYKLSRRFFINMLPIVVATVVLYIQQKLIYEYNVGSFNKEASSLEFTRPFEVWRGILPGWYIPVAVLLSFVFPLSYFILFGKPVVIRRTLWYYCVSLLGCGLLISIFLAEGGPRKYDLNFFWQNIICCYLLNLLVVTDALWRYWNEKGKHPSRRKLFMLIYLLHVVSGIIYIAKLFVTGSFF